jgi:hypothetical protein
MSTGGGGTSNIGDFSVVSYDYGTDDKQSQSHKPPMFTGDPKKFSW